VRYAGYATDPLCLHVLQGALTNPCVTHCPFPGCLQDIYSSHNTVMSNDTVGEVREGAPHEAMGIGSEPTCLCYIQLPHALHWLLHCLLSVLATGLVSVHMQATSNSTYNKNAGGTARPAKQKVG
jgi:hypothetical protein